MRIHHRAVFSLVISSVIGTAKMLSQAPSPQTTLKPATDTVGAINIPRFDIVSVKETHGDLIRERMPADGYIGTGVRLGLIVVEAYDVKASNHLINLPAWNSEKRFDIEAKVNSDDVPMLQKLTYPERRTMLKQILAERFQLKIHEEEQVLPIYLLTATNKTGPFLEKSQSHDPSANAAPGQLRVISRIKTGELTEERFTMTDFAEQLSQILHVTVVNGTDLEGLYNIQLDWNPDDAVADASGGSDIGETDSLSNAPSIFTAVREQLGLKLKPTKGPVKVWVIDHVELPSVN